MGPDLHDRLGGQDFSVSGSIVSSCLQVPGETGHYRTKTEYPW
jgi:hypothetical protein